VPQAVSKVDRTYIPHIDDPYCAINVYNINYVQQNLLQNKKKKKITQDFRERALVHYNAQYFLYFVR